MNGIRNLDPWIGWGAKILAAVAGTAAVLMMVNVVADVSAKYLFNSPIPGSIIFVANYYMVAIVFAAIPLVQRNQRTIVVDIFYDLMPRKIQRILLLLALTLECIFFTVLFVLSVFAARASYQKGEFIEGIADVVIWPSKILPPLGFALAAAVVTLQALQIALSSPEEFQEDEKHKDRDATENE